MEINAPVLSVADAAQYAQKTLGAANTEPGFANTYGPGADKPGGLLAAAIPAAGVSALSLYLLYKRRLQDEQEAKQLEQKQADWRAQLPGIHPKDILLGGALGGSAGLLYDLAAKQKPGEKRLPKALKRILGGAAIGGAGANLVGDRLRRYISNTVIPLDYNVSDKAKQLKPQSVRQFIDAAIRDKPAFDPKRVGQYVQTTGADPKDMLAQILARRELNRIAFGVERLGPQSIWQLNKGTQGPDYYSLNERNQVYAGLRERLFGPRSESARGILSHIMPGIAPAAAAENKEPLGWRDTGLFGADTLLGGQQVIIPEKSTYPLTGRVLDRYDVTPAKDELSYARDAIRRLNIFSPSWWAARRDRTSDEGYDQSNKEFMGGLAGRLFWDKILTEKHPWVSQQFRINAPVPDTPTLNQFQLLKEDGTP